MSAFMDWSQDFCLSCDNANLTEGPYCSEACRLLDLGRSTDTDSRSSAYSLYASSSTYSWSAASSPSRSSGIYLPPAVNFSALRSTTLGATSLPSTTPYLHHAATHHAATAPPSSSRRHQHNSHSKRGLTTSSSRSSLSSVTTTGSVSHGMSSNAIDQLRSYVNSFDQSRELKRRITHS